MPQTPRQRGMKKIRNQRDIKLSLFYKGDLSNTLPRKERRRFPNYNPPENLSFELYSQEIVCQRITGAGQ